VYMCQKLWKLASSRQSYCKNYLAYFFWPTLYTPSAVSHGYCSFRRAFHWCTGDSLFGDV